MSFSDAIFNPSGGSRDLRTNEQSVRVLLVEDIADYATLVATALRRADRGEFDVVHAARLETAMERLAAESYDAMLLDLGLTDGHQSHTIDTAGSIAQRLPVIVLTGTQDRTLATRAAEAGAEEHLVKQCVDGAELPATILRAIKRHRRLGGGASDPIVCRIPTS